MNVGGRARGGLAWLGRQGTRAIAVSLVVGILLPPLAAGGAAPDLTWLYFATAQFPIYLVPLLISPLIARWLASRLPPG
jgi:hypothetical protein